MSKKRLFRFVFAFVLMFSIAFAVEGKAEAKEMAEETVILESMTANSVEGITATSMLYSTTEEPEYEVYTISPNGYGFIPVEAANTGNMYFDYYVSGMVNASRYVRFEVVDEENRYLIESGQQYQYNTNTSKTFYEDGEAVNKGPHYAAKGSVNYIFVQNLDPNNTFEIGVRARLHTTGQRTLSQGLSKWTTFSAKNKDGKTAETWFKVKPDRTGVMTFSLMEYGDETPYGYVTLYNSDKKELSEKVYYGKKLNFGVKKNVTYYVKVTDCYGNYDENYRVGVRYSMTARTDRAIGKKANAKTLTRKADATNTLFVASRSTSTDWYKFKVTSKRETIIKVSAKDMASAKLTITVYCGSKKIGTANLSGGREGEYTITNGTTWGKANAGTYYVKIVKDAKTSGKYTVRYVK